MLLYKEKKKLKEKGTELRGRNCEARSKILKEQGNRRDHTYVSREPLEIRPEENMQRLFFPPPSHRSITRFSHTRMADDKAEPEPVSKRPKRCPENRTLESRAFRDFIERFVPPRSSPSPRQTGLFYKRKNKKSATNRSVSATWQFHVVSVYPIQPSPLSLLPLRAG